MRLFTRYDKFVGRQEERGAGTGKGGEKHARGGRQPSAANVDRDARMSPPNKPTARQATRLGRIIARPRSLIDQVCRRFPPQEPNLLAREAERPCHAMLHLSRQLYPRRQVRLDIPPALRICRLDHGPDLLVIAPRRTARFLLLCIPRVRVGQNNNPYQKGNIPIIQIIPTGDGVADATNALDASHASVATRLGGLDLWASGKSVPSCGTKLALFFSLKKIYINK